MKPEFDANEAMCRKCIYWNPNNIKEVEWNGDNVYLYETGECRLNPPVVNFTCKGESNCIQPETTFTHWCGQYQVNINAKIGYCFDITNKENIPHFDTTKPFNQLDSLNQ